MKFVLKVSSANVAPTTVSADNDDSLTELLSGNHWVCCDISNIYFFASLPPIVARRNQVLGQDASVCCDPRAHALHYTTTSQCAMKSLVPPLNTPTWCTVMCSQSRAVTNLIGLLWCNGQFSQSNSCLPSALHTPPMGPLPDGSIV